MSIRICPNISGRIDGDDVSLILDPPFVRFVAVAGPYYVDAIEVYSAGSQAGAAYSAGAQSGEVYSAGSQAGAVLE